MRYGLPYSASKNGIAEWVIDTLPKGNRLVDLFAGGCAITHCAMLSGKYNYFLANDIGKAPEIFKMAINGELDGYCTVPDREQFNAEKYNDYVMSLINSFGNNKRSYLWSKKLEDVKVHASRMLVLPSTYERRMEYKKFIKALNEYVKSGGAIYGPDKKDQTLISLESLERLGRIQSLESLERLGRIQSLERLEISNLDYRQVPIYADDVVYADPPYAGTNSTCNDDNNSFDYEAFYDWLNSRDFPVFISEYTCPRGCVEIARIERKSRMSGGTGAVNIEKIFVQEKFKDKFLPKKSDEQISLFE